MINDLHSALLMRKVSKFHGLKIESEERKKLREQKKTKEDLCALYSCVLPSNELNYVLSLRPDSLTLNLTRYINSTYVT